MPKVSDVMKVPFSGLTAVKGYATGNYADAVANTALMAGQLGYAFGKYYAPDKWKKHFGAEVYLLEIGIQLVTALTILHGSATDQGQFYELGSEKFELAWENLKDATVGDGSWSGDSADAYDSRNAAQLDWAKTMSGLDASIAAILARQAGEVKDAKLALTYCRAALTVAIPVAVALRAWNPMASWAFQIATFGMTMSVATIITNETRINASANGTEIDAITAQYNVVADSASVTGADSVAPTATPAPKTTVGEFGTVGGATAPAPAAPGIAAPAPVSRSSAAQSPVSATVPSTAGGDTPEEYPVPGVAAPGVAAGGAPQTGIAAAFGTPVGGPTATRAPGAAPAAPRGAGGEKPSAPASSVDDEPRDEHRDGAGAGAEHTERVPLDAVDPAAAEQARERVR